jgi:hypothetical protein
LVVEVGKYGADILLFDLLPKDNGDVQPTTVGVDLVEAFGKELGVIQSLDAAFEDETILRDFDLDEFGVGVREDFCIDDN